MSTNDGSPLPEGMSRRHFIRSAAAGATAIAALPLTGSRCVGATTATGPVTRVVPLDGDWLFGGEFIPEATKIHFDDSEFSRVTLPHCVTPLSWQGANATTWEKVWIYRRHFNIPEDCRNTRAFLQFDAAMVSLTPAINEHDLPEHSGGYLPARYEITEWMKATENLLTARVDARWQSVPPEGSPRGSAAVDFIQPGGIHRSARLEFVPQVFVSDVFAKPVKVLDAGRSAEVSCTIDAGKVPDAEATVRVELRDGARVVAQEQKSVRLEKQGETIVPLALKGLGNIILWDVDAPKLYDVVTTLLIGGKPVHNHRARIGFREAKFTLDGFFLNGRRIQIFGLNRHELFPYVGYAMPPRVMRRDAEILKRQLNCNMVRCSHYPQSETFLDACDEFGILVWEEMPGWGFIGDQAWQDLAVRDVRTMIRRDRNHPSIIIWGARVNESANNPPFYKRTRDAALELDDSRPTSGAMVGGRYGTKDWHQDVFAYNDYNHDKNTGVMKLKPPIPGVPFFITEAVGQVVGVGPSEMHMYRRSGEPALQAKQAIYHAQAHDQAAENKQNCGVVAWCAFEYGSNVKVARNGLKYPGVMDTFRIPKLGASFYMAQVSPKERPVIEPNFYWDFGPQTPNGPGRNSSIFSNCERLELFLDGVAYLTLQPDKANFSRIAYPPFFADLDLDGGAKSELRIDGFVDGKLVISKTFASDTAQDQLWMESDDKELIADGADATRVVFRATDRYGAPRPFFGGRVNLEVGGPGELVGDNSINWDDCGGAAAVWVKTMPGKTGRVEVRASHATLGAKSVVINVRQAGARPAKL